MSHSREREAFAPILGRMRIPSDGALIVHSAIARLSHKGFRAEAMIETFLEHLPRGMLLMPTMTWRTVTKTDPRWDELATPSHTGVMSEIFRTGYATARSIHPTHSVAGCGPGIELILSRHHLDDTPVSQNSPYGLLRDYPAFVLMIGVGLETCTAIHLPEETIAEDIYVRPEIEAYQCRDRRQVPHLVNTRRHWSLDRDFPKFAPQLQAAGELEAGEIEGCPYQIVPMRALLRDVFAAIIKDPRATLRDEARAAAR